MRRMRRAKARRELMKDFALIIVGVIIAVFLVRTGSIDWLIDMMGGRTVASFFAGAFFTSAFTIAPAAVALAHIADSLPHGLVAVSGALGAMCGDLLLFLFIRDRFAHNIMSAMKPSLVKHIMASLHLGFMKWLSPLIGALIIASPLPDEFGLTLMGLSKVRVIMLMPISFTMNALGIYAILWFSSLV